jgi:AraC-like DNA-binding protein
MTRARPSRHVGEDVLLLQIAPAAARQLLGVPVCELTDRVVPLDEVSARLALELTQRVEAKALAELVRPLPCDARSARFAAAAKALARGCAVRAVAERVALSERQLERLCYEHSGMAPKLFARVVRFRRAVMTVRGGSSFAAAAAAHGYADQAHFSADARAFAERSLSGLLPNVGNLQDLLHGAL